MTVLSMQKVLRVQAFFLTADLGRQPFVHKKHKIDLESEENLSEEPSKPAKHLERVQTALSF